MAKGSITTGNAGDLVHTRTTAGSEESEAVVLGIDGSDSVVPATTADGLLVNTELAAAATIVDGGVSPSVPHVAVYPLLLGAGGAWNRQTANQPALLLSSAARTSTTSASDQTNYNSRGVCVTLNVTAGTTLLLTVEIQGKDITGSVYWNCTASPTAIVGTGLYVYELYPGIGVASGGVTARTSGTLPYTWRVTVTHGNANSATYSLRAATIL